MQVPTWALNGSSLLVLLLLCFHLRLLLALFRLPGQPISRCCWVPRKCHSTASPTSTHILLSTHGSFSAVASPLLCFAAARHVNSIRLKVHLLFSLVIMCSGQHAFPPPLPLPLPSPTLSLTHAATPPGLSGLSLSAWPLNGHSMCLSNLPFAMIIMSYGRYIDAPRLPVTAERTDNPDRQMDGRTAGRQDGLTVGQAP